MIASRDRGRRTWGVAALCLPMRCKVLSGGLAGHCAIAKTATGNPGVACRMVLPDGRGRLLVAAQLLHLAHHLELRKRLGELGVRLLVGELGLLALDRLLGPVLRLGCRLLVDVLTAHP